MIEPGLYIHHKSTKLYRVLFVARAWSIKTDVAPDQPVYLDIAEGSTRSSPSVFLRFAGSEDSFLTARWSGNGTTLAQDEAIVIYVALYGNGRVAARPLKEFEERVDVPCKDVRGATHNVPRFERISE